MNDNILYHALDLTRTPTGADRQVQAAVRIQNTFVKHRIDRSAHALKNSMFHD